MFKSPKSPDMTQLAGAALLNAVGGQQSEHTEYNIHTQVMVPLAQDLLLMFTFIAWLLGAALLLSGVVWLARALDDPALLVMAAMSLVIAGYGVLGGELYLQRRYKPKLAPSLLLTTGFVVADVIAVALILDILRLVADWSPLFALTVAGGIALVIAPCFLIWRIGHELVDPTYPRGPMIDMMMRWLGSGEGQETKTVREPVPYRNGVRETMIDPNEPQPPRDELSPDFRDLVAFIQRAQIVGFGRSQWLNAARVIMPSHRRMTRGLYDKMIAKGTEWGIIEPGGGGVDASWKIEPDAALRRLVDAGTQVLDHST